LQNNVSLTGPYFRKWLSTDEDAAASITEKVLQCPAYKEARRISIFLSMPRNEVCTRKLVEQALAAGKKVFVPYIHASGQVRNQEMDMLELRSQHELDTLKPDAWGIPTLDNDSVAGRQNALGGLGIVGIGTEEMIVEPSFLDMIFMPAVAFDLRNGRLGHGKGFYDRYLQRYRKVALAGKTEKRMPLLSRKLL